MINLLKSCSPSPRLRRTMAVPGVACRAGRRISGDWCALSGHFRTFEFENINLFDVQQILFAEWFKYD